MDTLVNGMNKEEFEARTREYWKLRNDILNDNSVEYFEMLHILKNHNEEYHDILHGGFDWIPIGHDTLHTHEFGTYSH